MIKKITAMLLAFVLLIPLLAGCSGGTGGDDFSLATEWVDEHIESDSLFSFKYEGASFASFIGTWDKKVERGEDADGNGLITLSYTQPDDRVTAVATIILYKDSPAVDWVVNFTNNADGDSPVISDIQAMNSYVEYPKDEYAVLTYANGSTAVADDFLPATLALTNDMSEPFTLSCLYGRSSSGTMPYFDILTSKGGVIGAIGWTGQWTARFLSRDGRAYVQAGMSETEMSLHAGESMRTPSMVLLFFGGDADYGHNLFRQLVLKHYTPADETGEPVTELPMMINLWGGDGEKILLDAIKNINDLGIPYDGVWIDAGWYGLTAALDTYDNTWYTEAGTWKHIEEIYPEGFSNIADYLHEKDKEFLLWFEPERVARDSELYNEHRDYLLGSDVSSSFLIDLSRDEVTDFLIDLIDSKIKEYKLDWYRQDFNIDPLEKWMGNDVIDAAECGVPRTGMTEIKYITNLYRFLGSLVELNPGLMIDNCASGGRRLDIEMMKLSVPLFNTDYCVSGPQANENTTDGMRSLHINLAYWLPLSGSGYSQNAMTSQFDYRSSFSNSSAAMIPRDWSRATPIDSYIAEYEKLRTMLTGDYYILSNPLKYTEENNAYMYYLPDKGEGYLAVFRPQKSPDAFEPIQFKGLDAKANYELVNADTGTVITATGKQLMEGGISVKLTHAMTSVIIYINKV